MLLAPPVVRVLDAYLAGRTGGPLFHARDGSSRYRYRSAHEQLARLCRIAGLPAGVTPHSLRHFYATESLHLGAALQDVQDALGHADPRTTRRYAATATSSTAPQPPAGWGSYGRRRIDVTATNGRRDLIGRATRRAVREMSGTVLRQVDGMWQDEGFAPGPEPEPPVGGQWVSLFQSYMDSVDWTDTGHVARALRVFEVALRGFDREYLGTVMMMLERDGFRYRILAEEFYEVGHNFPRLSRTSLAGDLPEGVSTVSYNLALAACRAWRRATSPAEPTAVGLLDALKTRTAP